MDPGALARRRAGDDGLDARDLRHDHRHERGGEHRVAPAGNVGADGPDRDVPVAERDPGKRLDLEVGEGVALRLREAADLLLREGDVVAQLVVDPLRGVRDVALATRKTAGPSHPALASSGGSRRGRRLDRQQHLGYPCSDLLRHLGAVDRRVLEVFGHQ